MATDLPTLAELAQIGQQKLRSLLDPQGTGSVDLHAGSRNDIAISVNTAMAMRLTQHVADRLSARLISQATGDDLAAIGSDFYQDAPKPSNSATGIIYLQRTGTAATVIPAGSVFAVPATSSAQGVQFNTLQDTAVPLNGGQAGSPIPVNLTCTQVGLVGNVQVSTITSIVNQLPDATWTIAALPAGAAQYCAGGAELETDDQFRARLQQSAYDDSKKRGTKRAITQGALQVPGVANVTIVEPLDGTIAVYVGDANYNLSSSLSSAVATALENWRPFGVPVLVRSYTVNTLTLVATLYMQRALSNYNVPAIQAQAVTNVLNYLAQRQRPDEVFGPALTAAMVAASPEAQTATINSLVSSGTTQPDSTFSIHRQVDSTSPTSLPRYVATNQTILISVLAPQ